MEAAHDFAKNGDAEAWLRAQLADAGFTKARVQNWKSGRDIPLKEHEAVAAIVRRPRDWLTHGTVVTDRTRTDTKWPFSLVDRVRWDSLSPPEQIFVQRSINLAIDQCEQMRSSAPSKSRLVIFPNRGNKGVRETRSPWPSAKKRTAEDNPQERVTDKPLRGKGR